AVLIDRRSGPAGGRVLDEIVLPGTLDEDAELERVIFDDLRGVVRPRVDEPGPKAWVGACVDAGQPGDLQVRHLLWKELGAWEEEGEVDAVGRALALGPAAGVGINGALPVGIP